MAALSIGVGIAILFVFLILLLFGNYKFSGFNLNDDSIDLTYKIGCFLGAIIGPFWALAGIFLYYTALIYQKEDIRKSQIASEIQSFENTFFNLLNTQQELLKNIDGHFYTFKNFKHVHLNSKKGDFFRNSIQLVDVIFNSLTNKKYLGYFDQEEADYHEGIIKDRNVNHIDYEYDIKEGSLYHKKKLINKHYDITEVLWNELRTKTEYDKVCKAYEIYFLKHNHIVGHYFRHLYNIIKYIKSTKEALSKREIDFNDRKYAAFIQAQMSSYELALLFYNVLSFPKAKELIKEYKLLDNLPKDLLIRKSDFFEQSKIQLKNQSELWNKQLK